MKLYAFIMVPGSGKTYNSEYSHYFVDIDRAINYYSKGELYETLLENFRLSSWATPEWNELLAFKVAALKHYLKEYYDPNDTIVVFLHSPSEAMAMEAEVLGHFKPTRKEIETFQIENPSRFVMQAWEHAKPAEILSREEIHNRIIDIATSMDIPLDI